MLILSYIINITAMAIFKISVLAVLVFTCVGNAVTDDSTGPGLSISFNTNVLFFSL